MFGRPPGTALARRFMGRESRRAPWAAMTSGTSPASGSETMTLRAPRMISSAKRSVLPQSRATRMSCPSPWVCTGCPHSLSMAAASPPRIWGPTERVNKP